MHQLPHRLIDCDGRHIHIHTDAVPPSTSNTFDLCGVLVMDFQKMKCFSLCAQKCLESLLFFRVKPKTKQFRKIKQKNKRFFTCLRTRQTPSPFVYRYGCMNDRIRMRRMFSQKKMFELFLIISVIPTHTHTHAHARPNNFSIAELQCSVFGWSFVLSVAASKQQTGKQHKIQITISIFCFCFWLLFNVVDRCTVFGVRFPPRSVAIALRACL